MFFLKLFFLITFLAFIEVLKILQLKSARGGKKHQKLESVDQSLKGKVLMKKLSKPASM